MGDQRVVSLVRDVLDNQLVARGAQIGKVDDIVLMVRAEGPPEVVALECGGTSAARRLEPPLRNLLCWAARRWGITGGEPHQIAWNRVRRIGRDVEVDVNPEETPAGRWDAWVRRRVLSLIPGA